MIPLKEPEFNWKWNAEGVPGVTTVPYGDCCLIIKEDLVADPTIPKLKQYFTLGEVEGTVYTADNYTMISEVMKYGPRSLYVLVIDSAETISASDFDLIQNKNINYAGYPEMDPATEEAVILSEMADLNDNFNVRINFILPKPATVGTEHDQTYLILFDIEEGLDSEGNTVTSAMMIPTLMGQRVSMKLDQSLTYKQVGKLASCKLFRSVEDKLSGGVMTVIEKNGKLVYARDINAMSTITGSRDETFRQNQIKLAMDTLEIDIRNSWETDWVGKFINSGDNKRGYVGSVNSYILLRAQDTTDPVQSGSISIDLEAHKQILRDAGKTEDYINSLTQTQLEDIDTGTFVYVVGKIQINGIMEDVTYNVTKSKQGEV